MNITIDNIIKISTNKIYAGTHWRNRNKIKEDYLWLTKSYFKQLKPVGGKVDLHFTFFFKKNALDSSNCSYMAKMLEDCLVAYGVLKDDTIKYVGRVSFESVKCEEKEKKVDWCLIEMQEISEDVQI